MFKFSQKRRKSLISGFSITELLIGSVLGAMAVSGLLFLMVNLLQENQQEQAKSSVEDDMRRALDYIANDLREAVYVYTGEQLEGQRQPSPNIIAGLTTYLPDFGTGVRPILAFWKVENLPYGGTGSFPAGNVGDDCGVLFRGNQAQIDRCEAVRRVRVERRTYTLVVYTQSTVNTDNRWQGESRIERYQLRKYSSLDTLAITPGYVDPVSESTFDRWPFSANNVDLRTGTMDDDDPNRKPQPLVDFVARPAAAQLTTTTPQRPISCPSTITGGALEYVATPRDASSPADFAPDNAGTFFACVRNPRGDQSFNQDVIVYLRGNVKGKPSPNPTRDQFLDTLQTRVISRGVVGKAVTD
jgi:hypothetical protein